MHQGAGYLGGENFRANDYLQPYDAFGLRSWSQRVGESAFGFKDGTSMTGSQFEAIAMESARDSRPLTEASPHEFNPLRENLGMAAMAVIVLVAWLLYRKMIELSRSREKVSNELRSADDRKDSPNS